MSHFTLPESGVLPHFPSSRPAMTKKRPFKRTAAALMIVCALIVHTSGHSAPHSSSAADNAVRLIAQHYELGESNPIHMDDAEHLNTLFNDVLTRRKQLSGKERNKVHCESIGHYAASVCHKFNLEDSIDEYRALMSGGMALATAALTSTPQEALPYFELAKTTLLESKLSPEYGMERHYAALLLLEALYRSEYALLDHAKKKLLLQDVSNCKTLPVQQKKLFVEAIQEFE